MRAKNNPRAELPIVLFEDQAAWAAWLEAHHAESPGLWTALVSTRYPLLLALLGGVVLGVALALLSLLAPGVLPTLG